MSMIDRGLAKEVFLSRGVLEGHDAIALMHVYEGFEPIISVKDLTRSFNYPYPV
jgi:hypothetical protein